MAAVDNALICLVAPGLILRKASAAGFWRLPELYQRTYRR